MERYMKTTVYISFFMVLLQFSIAPPVLAETDKKIASSTVCQGVSPQDRANLRYNGSSLEAVGAHVEVVCAIIRDSSMSKMNFIEVRFKRKNGDLFSDGRPATVTGVVHSCDSEDGGCEKKEVTTRTGQLNNINDFVSTKVETPDLPHSSAHYFTYKVTLREGWKLVRIMYQEEI
jgi:hypothetical protein